MTRMDTHPIERSIQHWKYRDAGTPTIRPGQPGLGNVGRVNRHRFGMMQYQLCKH
jgi:hypothetical protein